MVLVLLRGPGHRMCIDLSVLLVWRYPYVVQTLRVLLDDFLAFIRPKYDGLNMVTNAYGCQMSCSIMTLNLIQVRRRRDQNVLRAIWRYEETKRPSCAATVLLVSMRSAQAYQRTPSRRSTTPSIHGSAWPVVYQLSRTHSLTLRSRRSMIQLRTIL